MPSVRIFIAAEHFHRPLASQVYATKDADCGIWSAHKSQNVWITRWLFCFTIITLIVLFYLGFAFYKCLKKHQQNVNEGYMDPLFVAKLRIRLILYIICLLIAYLLPLFNKLITNESDKNSRLHKVFSYSGTFMFCITGVLTFIFYSLNSDAWEAVRDMVCCRKEEEEKPGSAILVREKSITHEMMLSVLEYKDITNP